MSACPHCQAAYQRATAFCVSCGKALPDPVRVPPRVVSESRFATSEAGRTLQAESLERQSRVAAKIIGLVAGINLLFGVPGVLFGLAANPRTPAEQELAEMKLGNGIANTILGLIFAGLFFWARRSPLPAAITGLVIFVTIHAVDVLLALGSDQPQLAARGLVMKIAIVAMLAQAIVSGVKHRTLLRTAGG